MDMVGLGFSYSFDKPKRRAVEDEDAPPVAPKAEKPAPIKESDPGPES